MDPEKFIDLYKLIGLDISASRTEIERACLKLGGELRPDKGMKGDPSRAARFRLVERAYETLCDDEKREAYDRHYNDRLIQGFPTQHNPKWRPEKRDGVLLIVGAIAAAAIVTVLADITVGPSNLGLLTQLRYATFYLFSYKADGAGPFGTRGEKYLIEVDALVLLLICFLSALYGLLVLIDILPRPMELWKQIKKLISFDSNDNLRK